MPISVEWIRPNIGIARAGPDHVKYMDPWNRALVIDGQRATAILKFMTEKPCYDDMRKLYRELKIRDYSVVVWFEPENGKMVEKFRRL